MAKQTGSQYVCQNCGTSHAKWAGRCESCGSWNSLVEEQTRQETQLSHAVRGGGRLDIQQLAGQEGELPRLKTEISEFDRVCGGGLVPASAVLIGGDPGIGKSTILLQVAAALANRGKSVLYISGEEAREQVRLRARRLSLDAAPVDLAATTNVRDIVSTIDGLAGQKQAPDLVIIDSIQTMYLDALESAPGSVGQVRGSAQELIRLAKKRGFVLLLVGHITKEGTIAGPKVLEHMVDAVLQFEGDRSHHFRLLRAAKNRFGPADEIGVFEMSESGLTPVDNPSELFLADREDDVTGSAVFAGIEGSRPVLMEIQTLVAPSPLGTPRRTVVGWDGSRLSMVLAVLETRAGVSFGANDVFLSVAGGLKISEPAADLAVAASLLSSLVGDSVPNDLVVFGELGLSGEIRPVAGIDQRLREAEKLGFKRAWVPPLRKKQKSGGMKLKEISRVSDLALQFSPPNS